MRSDRATYQFLFDAANPQRNRGKTDRFDGRASGIIPVESPFRSGPCKGPRRRRASFKEAPQEIDHINWLYQLLYSRPPSKEETRVGLHWLERPHGDSNQKEAWEDYCQALICANEFIYVD